jgi:Zn ribbon nucleic-acid-binding protein
MQCYSCFDSAMFQYHGSNYNVIEEQHKYLENYKKIGLPVIECVSCGNRKKLIQKEDKRWQEIFVPTIKSDTE